MDHHLDVQPGSVPSEQRLATGSSYEAPQADVVVTADDLEREALYAGTSAYGLQ